MRRTAAVSCALILAALSGLHVAWASGSKVLAAGVVPSRVTNDGVERGPLFEPTPASTVAVAVGLAIAAFAVLRAGFTGRGKLAGWLVSLAFGARALGDFRYLGFSKRVKGTEFARRDSRVYAPLCVVISTLAAGAST